MATFREANQVRVILKMKLANHAWYRNSAICGTPDGWGVIISVGKLDNKVRKLSTTCD